MELRPLRHTGVSVSKLCLGAMMFGAWGSPDHDESTWIIHATLDAGTNFIDTADVYGEGESEEIVGKALAGELTGGDTDERFEFGLRLLLDGLEKRPDSNDPASM